MGRYNRQERRFEFDNDAELQLWAGKLGVPPQEPLTLRLAGQPIV